MLHLRYGGDQRVRNVLVWQAADRLAAYGHLDVTDEVAGASAEVVVHPAYRRHGLGRLLVAATLAETPDGRLRLWAHGGHPGAAALAAALGFRQSRALWQMRRSLYAAAARRPTLPAGVTVRTFEPGRDDEAWVGLNARPSPTTPSRAAGPSTTCTGGWPSRGSTRHGFFLADAGRRRAGRLPLDQGARRRRHGPVRTPTGTATTRSARSTSSGSTPASAAPASGRP